ncbi:MAG: phage tail tape measure protein [Beijerinckiaceae bacterium]
MNDTTQTAREGSEAFAQLDVQARQAGRSIAAALSAGQVEGWRLDDTLRGVGQRLGTMALQSAGQGLGQLLGSTLRSGLVSAAASGAGFSLASPISLMGLGGLGGAADSVPAVASPQLAQQARPVAVTMNISTPDAESFRRSEAQVSSALARAVQRGQRSL